ncbi:MAG: PAS domain-containing protein [Cyanobacteria bacterium RU_5_0]|nr:PAS domain-containing protein [Cyanobacteria bacterium RU_5_0]
MAFLDFLLGSSIGLSLVVWQRSRFNARLRKMLRNLQPEVSEPSSSFPSQLAFAIAQQQRFQQQLEQQLDTHTNILQAAPVGYVQVDDENRLIWCNLKARKLLGITQETYNKPRLLLEVVRSYELDELIEQTRNAGEPRQSNWMFYPVSSDPSRLSEQQAYPIRGYGLPLPDKQVGIFLESRQEAIMLMQQRDRWASDLAHELRTPLTSIRLVAETLQTRLNPPLKTWVDRLINETVRLSNLVQDLLDLSRMERDSFHALKLKTTDLVELIHAVWDSLEPLAHKKNLTLDYTGPNCLSMQLDEARIHRLLINLLDNSIKHSPPDQKILISIRVEPPEMGESYNGVQLVYLEIIDYGTGFPEKDLPHVFERFYRADLSRTRLSLNALSEEPSESAAMSQNGSGLGLAIVRQIVEAHQGSISASNHPDTGGAWLQVRLPLHSPDLSPKE